MKFAATFKVLVIVSLSVFYLLTLSGLSFGAEIDDIQNAIKSSKAKWTASSTSIHRMDAHARKYRASLQLPSLSASAGSSSANAAALGVTGATQSSSLAFPLTAPTGGFDWRNNAGTNYVTPVKDQGNCGSCWAFATTAALESYTLIHGTYNSGLNLSEQVMLSCSNAGSCETGGTLNQASIFSQQVGLPPDSMFPYTAKDSACTLAAPNWQSATDKIAVWDWISMGQAPTIASVKNALYTYGPLVASMNVYSDFFAYSGGVYAKTSGTLAGGHAILIVGYADDAASPGGGYLIAKNSWGTGWGEPFGTSAGGFFRIAYSETTSPTSATQFGWWLIAYDPTPPTCSFALSATSNSFPIAGGSGSASVTTGNSCTWSAKSDSSWLTLPAGVVSSGRGTLSYAAAANTGSTGRTGVISVVDAHGNAAGTLTVTQQGTSASYTVSGTVRSSSGTALAGVSVNLAGKSTSTSSTGAFSFSGIAAGSYSVTAALSGYNTYTSTALTVGANQVLAITLVPATYSVSGSVKSGTTAVPGASVSIGSLSATTANDGSFTISGIGAGAHTITVSKATYTTYSGSLGISANLTGLNISLVQPGFTVSGTVLSSSNGSPLPGASVSVAGKTASTDAKGAFSLSGVAAGSYALNVALPGYLTFNYPSLAVAANLSVTVSMAPVPPPSYTVTGIVTSSSGSGLLPGAVVTIGSKSVTVPSSGIYSISIAAGSYPVTVSKAGYLPYSKSALSITATQNLNFTLTPIIYTVSGVIESNGAALAGATVSVAGRSVTSDSTGSFSIGGVVAGTYSLSVAKTGYTTYTNGSFAVTGNQSVSVSLAHPSYSVSGVLKSSSTGLPLGGATFSLAGQTVTSAADGLFTVTGVFAGNYSYTVSKASYNSANGSLSVSGNVSGLTCLLTQPVFTVTGIVTSSTGSGLLPGAVVTIGDKSVTITSSGIYSISGITPGSYSISVSKTGYVPYARTGISITSTQNLNFILTPAK